jgi:hypothetical protein
MSAIFAVVLMTPKPMVDFSSRALGTREEPDVQNSTLIILVVEDEPLIQDMVQEALFDGGFKTEMASSGEAAITLLGDNKGKYRALITEYLFRREVHGVGSRQARKGAQSGDRSGLHDRRRD